MTTSEQTSNPIEQLFRSWRLYREIIQNNYMFHEEISCALKSSFEQLKLEEPLRILDLGCGDASMILPMMNRDRVTHYLGCDLSQPALDMAGQVLTVSGIDHDLMACDMLEYIQTLPDGSQDLVFSSYALHHLSHSQKQSILTEIGRILRPGGSFMLVDIFREPDESRESYLRNYMGRLNSTWVALSEESRERVVDHATRFDFPEAPDFYQQALLGSCFVSACRLAKHTWHEAWRFQRSAV